MKNLLKEAKNKLYLKLREKQGDFVVNHGVVFIIIIILGAIVISVLSSYIETDFSNMIKTKIEDFFN